MLNEEFSMTKQLLWFETMFFFWSADEKLALNEIFSFDRCLDFERKVSSDERLMLVLNVFLLMSTNSYCELF